MHQPTKVHSRGRPPYPDVLTPAEWEVLSHVRKGLSNRQIAHRRGTSVDAVKYHLSNIRLKLEMEDRYSLMEWPGEPSIPIPGVNATEELGRMIRDFDVNPKTGEIAVYKGSAERVFEADILTKEGEVTGGIPSTYMPQWPRWSSDGSNLYFFGIGGPLYRKGRNDNELEVVLDDPAGTAGFQAWSPDGTKVTYQYRHRDFMFGGDPMHNLHMLDVATGDTTQITDDQETYDVFSIWSPSGKWVAIESSYVEPRRRKAVSLYEVETAELTEIPRQRCLLQRHSWSPDSRHLLVRINGDGWRRLEIIRVEDMETVWSHESPKVRGGAFAPDGRHFICEMAGELLWFDFPSGELSQKLSLDGIGELLGFAPGSQISFGPDGEVYFLTKESKIYRWEVGAECSLVVDAEPAQPLPEFTQEEYTVTSRDGFSIPIQRYIPAKSKRVAVMYVDSYGLLSPRKMSIPTFLENGYEVVLPGHRGMQNTADERKETRKGDVGRGEVWDIIEAAKDWKLRNGGDRPLVIFTFSFGGLFSLLALAKERHLWNGAVLMATLLRIETISRIWRWALPDDDTEREKALIERSPSEHAHKIRVPLRMFHGTRDLMSHVDDVREVQRRIEAAGGECTLTVYEKDIHLLGAHREEIATETLEFLRRFE